MKTPTNSTGSQTDSTEQVVPPVTKPDENAGFDDLGYEKQSEEETPTVVEPKKEEKKPEAKKADEPVKEEVTLEGYGDDEDEETPPVVEPKKEEKKPEEMTEEEKAQKEISDIVTGLPETFDKAKVSKFVLENKMTKEQVASYVKMAKDEAAQAVKDAAERTKTQRKQWKEELLNGKEFGGEDKKNYDLSVKQVQNLLQNNLPNTKKILTEKKGMLPPYLMKDLLAVAKALNPKEKFEGGEAPAPKEEPGNFLDDMYV